MKTWLYRHDDIVVHRPYAVDVDPDGWLWEGCGVGRLVGHHLRTAQLRVVPLPLMGRRVVYEVFAFKGKLVLVLGNSPFYLVYDPATGRCVQKPIPAAHPIVWYGARTPGRIVLFERSESKALLLDEPDGEPTVVPCPYAGELASGTLGSDGLLYCSFADPCRMVRFDPAAARFVDENPAPFPEATLSGKVEHGGVLYCADSARGRLLPLELASGRWRDPVATPDHGSVYGFVGAAFGFRGRAYYCLSTYSASSRLDRKTGRVIIPKGPITVDGRDMPRFMERMLEFDPASGRFGYLEAPPQPDGIPLLCYSWCDGSQFVVTGVVIPFAAPGEPSRHERGPWLLLRSEPAADEPPLGPYDFSWDRAAHMRQYRRSYARQRSVYLPEPPHTPATSNLVGSANQFPPGADAALARRAERTDPAAYWRHIVDSVAADLASDAERVKAILGFVNHAAYYNPIQESQCPNPIAALESHDLRCGAAQRILLELFKAAGIEVRARDLHHHCCAEVFYDGAWHIADALFFGASQPARDGRVLSIDELMREPFIADGYPQDGFLYDPELMLSEDGFQILGYVFGPWGAYPYYSWYLGGPKEHPPTVPVLLPAQRAGANAVTLRWAPSTRTGGGPIEYDVRVFDDRECRREIFRSATAATELRVEVPGPFRTCYVLVRAMDDHRHLNRDTWYPASRTNFVLAPEDTYGWYGVL